jgi:hypothetical protein
VKGDPRDDEADGLIRSWLRRADEFLRRPSGSGVTGKTGGTPEDPNGPSREQSGPGSTRSQEE